MIGDVQDIQWQERALRNHFDLEKVIKVKKVKFYKIFQVVQKLTKSRMEHKEHKKELKTRFRVEFSFFFNSPYVSDHLKDFIELDLLDLYDLFKVKVMS